MATTRLGAGNRNCIRILDVPIDCVSMDETVAMLRSFLASNRPHLVVTADAPGIVIAHFDPDFKRLVESADLVTPDGIGVLWAAKRKGIALPGRVSGVDIVDRMCALSADNGYRLYFLGSSSGVAEMAAEKLRLRHPGCNIVGAHHGYFPAESDEIVAKVIAEAKPDVLFVAMGMPRQEQFIRATQNIVGAKLAMGVGGSFDVFSGKTKRAPVAVQRLKAEWLWRLILNPSKISKVKLLPKFVMLVLREKKA